jgi:hypothetical protein
MASFEEISMRSMIRLPLVLAALVLGSASAFAVPAGRPLGTETRVTYPSVVSFEVLGRGMLYSVNFDEALNDDIAAGIGIGSVSTNLHDTDIDGNASATLVPVYFNYYLRRTAGSVFLTGGATLILNHAATKYKDTSTGNLQIPSSSVMPTFGAGYEYRTDTGFLFRVTGYAIAGKSITPWAGFTFGYAF